jgi:hypothetical protein
VEADQRLELGPRGLVTGVEPSFEAPVSQLCTESQFRSPAFAAWRERLDLAAKFEREVWEYCYVMQALSTSGALGSGARGLGFGVGREPLPAALAAAGCTVVATDQTPAAAAAQGWPGIEKYGGSLAALRRPAACSEAVLHERVSFRVVDMRSIDADLRGFDFVWSCCALEHLGGRTAGLTTEFNVFSNDATIETAGLVLYRERDITALVLELRRAGHAICLNFHLGSGPLDWKIDRWPYRFDPHLEITVKNFVATSLGQIIRKPG